MKKSVVVILTIFIIILIMGANYYLHGDVLYILKPRIDNSIGRIIIYKDLDNDGILDLDDILEGARKEVENKTKYKSAYYAGGYPPEDEGVCTDVIWRALENAGYDLKNAIDIDIEVNIIEYFRIETKDPNIDFRRVDNQYVFFKNHMKSLTTDIIPYNVENLAQWQGGDIIVLKKSNHVAIISDKRRKDGLPYIIHNAHSYAKEEDRLLFWYKSDRIIGHFRLKYDSNDDNTSSKCFN